MHLSLDAGCSCTLGLSGLWTTVVVVVIVSVALIFMFPVATEEMVKKKIRHLGASSIFDGRCKKNVSPRNVVSIGSRNPENGAANKKI